jgi:hypothetical protein
MKTKAYASLTPLRHAANQNINPALCKAGIALYRLRTALTRFAQKW